MACRKKIKTEIYIDGMHCMHCARAVEEALKNVDGVSAVKVDLENKKAIVSSFEEVNVNDVKSAVDVAGFSVMDVVQQ